MTEVEKNHQEELTEIGEACYVIDGRASRFTVQVFASGLLAAMGHNPIIGIRDFSGQVTFDPDHLKGSAFKLVARSSSLTVQDDISDKDRREIERLMNQEVLQPSRFSEITYEATDISIGNMGGALFSASLNGTLTLRGVTRSLPILARVVLLGSLLRASGEFSLRQSDFEIKPISVAGGALKLKDDLKCSFEIVARKQE
ncbi:MAG: YceI family protein [Terracidiphilus sp.]